MQLSLDAIFIILPSKPVALKYVTVDPAKVGNVLTNAARNLVKKGTSRQRSGKGKVCDYMRDINILIELTFLMIYLCKIKTNIL